MELDPIEMKGRAAGDEPALRIHIGSGAAPVSDPSAVSAPAAQAGPRRARGRKCECFCTVVKSVTWGMVRAGVGYGILGLVGSNAARFGVEQTVVAAEGASTVELLATPVILVPCLASLTAANLIWFRLTCVNSKVMRRTVQFAATIGGGLLPYWFSKWNAQVLAAYDTGEAGSVALIDQAMQWYTDLYTGPATQKPSPYDVFACAFLLTVLARVGSALLRDASNVNLKKVVGSHKIVDAQGGDLDEPTLMALQFMACIPVAVCYALAAWLNLVYGKAFLQTAIGDSTGSSTAGRLAGPALGALAVEFFDEFNQVIWVVLLALYKGYRVAYEPAGGCAQLCINLREFFKCENWNQIWLHASMRIFGGGFGEAAANRMQADPANAQWWALAAAALIGLTGPRAHFVYHGDRLRNIDKWAEIKLKHPDEPVPAAEELFSDQPDMPGWNMPEGAPAAIQESNRKAKAAHEAAVEAITMLKLVRGHEDELSQGYVDFLEKRSQELVNDLQHASEEDKRAVLHALGNPAESSSRRRQVEESFCDAAERFREESQLPRQRRLSIESLAPFSQAPPPLSPLSIHLSSIRGEDEAKRRHVESPRNEDEARHMPARSPRVAGSAADGGLQGERHLRPAGH